jgi:hypothetical protein
MLTIVVPALWILFDVLICIRTGYMTSPFPTWEWWAWLLSGIVLALLAVAGGWWDRRQAVRDVTQKHAEVTAGQETLASGMVMLARIINAQPNQSAEGIAELAVSRIQGLQTQISDLSGMFWRELHGDERIGLTDLIRNLGSHSIRVAADSQT